MYVGLMLVEYVQCILTFGGVCVVYMYMYIGKQAAVGEGNRNCVLCLCM